MVDLGSIWKINGIVTQGAPEEDAWVTSYRLQFSDTNHNDWSYYMAPSGPVDFIGNFDRYTISEGMLRQPITARWIRTRFKIVDERFYFQTKFSDQNYHL